MLGKSAINFYLLVLDGELVGGVVGADGEFDARVLLLALDQVVGHPRPADHVRRVVGADDEVFAGGHLDLETKGDLAIVKTKTVME